MELRHPPHGATKESAAATAAKGKRKGKEAEEDEDEKKASRERSLSVGSQSSESGYESSDSQRSLADVSKRVYRVEKNRKLGDRLYELGRAYFTRGDRERGLSHSHAAKLVRLWPEIITSGDQAREQIKGIGKKHAKTIDEILETGTSERFKQLGFE